MSALARGAWAGRWTLVMLLAAAIHVAPAWAQAAPDAIEGPFIGQAVAVGVSAEVHRLPVAVPAVVGPPVEINPRRGRPVPLPLPRPRVPDQLVAPAPAAAERTPTPLLSFDGISANGLVPPDPNGDVGPNHYVQMVNTRFVIYSKSGVLLSGPTNINQLFVGLAGSQCATRNDGDPIVVYDRFADRWLLSQFAVPGGPSGFHLCVAISQTPDPTGTYFLYDFSVPVFPDYFKIGVWPEGYYVSTNEEGTVPNTDVGVYALNRARMLQGLSASFIRFLAHGNFLLPSDAKGPTAPPAGSPNYFYTFTDSVFWSTGGVDRLDLYAFHADFATPGNSTFTALPSVTITPFNYTVCGYFVTACLPQPSPGETIDAISEWPMWRFLYRNMSSYEALVGNFTVDVGGGHAGIRWFELRKTGGGSWTLFQEGTHAPDSQHRFMGSIAMDGSGNIALGYSVTSATLMPSLRYATRLAGAAPGSLEAEATLISGTGVQMSGFHRWGDYSAMTIDPADDCTFWYTGEYYATTSAAGWSTRIGSFKIPTCTSPAVSLTVSPGSVAAGDSVTATWSGIPNPTTTDWIGLYVPGTANTAYLAWIYVSCSQTPGSAMASGSCAFSIPGGLAPGTYQLRLLSNNVFTLLATSSNFTVTAPGATLSVTPASAPAGGNVTATWSGIPNPTPTDWIGLYVPGAANTAYLAWIYVSCSKTPASAMASGSCAFVIPGGLAPATYQLRLLSNNGFTLLATSSNFTVTPGGATLSVAPTSVPAGGSVTATWGGIASPTTTDWIGLYVPGAPNTAYLAWIYVSCSQIPGAAMAAGSCAFTVPSSLTPGTYELRLLANNGYTALATSVPLTVTTAGPGLSVSPPTVLHGATVTATWSAIPSPTTTDWIGLFVPGSPNTAYIAWIYVSCSQTPGAAMAAGSCPFTIPGTLTPGTYELRLLSNNGYTRLATSNPLTVN